MMNNRLKSWVGFNDGKCDEDTQLLINDIRELESQLQTLKAFAEKAEKVAEFYSHEKDRDGWGVGSVQGTMPGHRYDISCCACNEDNKGKTAREFLNSEEYKAYREIKK